MSPSPLPTLITIPRTSEIDSVTLYTIHLVFADSSETERAVRYSTLRDLHLQLSEIHASGLPSFPGKALRNGSAVIEKRKTQIEVYLQGILTHSNPIWRESETFQKFLGIKKEAKIKPWAEEVETMHEDIKLLETIAKSREKKIQENANAEEETDQAHELIKQLNITLSRLTRRLATEELSEGEQIRRQDIISNARITKENIVRGLGSIRITGKGASDSSLGSFSRSPRVFSSAPKHRERDLSELSNAALVQVTHDTIAEQDAQLDSLLSVVLKQKSIGQEIGNQLDIHNEMLGSLDKNVEMSGTRVQTMQNRMGKFK